MANIMTLHCRTWIISGIVESSHIINTFSSWSGTKVKTLFFGRRLGSSVRFILMLERCPLNRKLGEISPKETQTALKTLFLVSGVRSLPAWFNWHLNKKGKTVIKTLSEVLILPGSTKKQLSIGEIVLHFLSLEGARWNLYKREMDANKNLTEVLTFPHHIYN